MLFVKADCLRAIFLACYFASASFYSRSFSAYFLAFSSRRRSLLTCIPGSTFFSVFKVTDTFRCYLPMTIQLVAHLPYRYWTFDCAFLVFVLYFSTRLRLSCFFEEGSGCDCSYCYDGSFSWETASIDSSPPAGENTSSTSPSSSSKSEELCTMAYFFFFFFFFYRSRFLRGFSCDDSSIDS